MWRFVSRCWAADLQSRGIEEVGLRTDGRFALIFSQNETGVVWDVHAGCVRRLLDHDDVQTADRFLDRQGFLNVNYGAGEGKYRILGFTNNFPLPEHRAIGLGLALDGGLQQVTLYALTTGASVAVLPHETIDGDSVIASFCDDGNTFAVVERAYAAFFQCAEAAEVDEE